MARTTMASLLLPGGVFHTEGWERLEPMLTPVKVAATALGERVPWSFLEKEVKTNIGDLLNIDISEVITAAWEKTEELRRYGDREQYPPEETIITELAEHTIWAHYDPSLEILMNEQVLPEIKLSVLFSLTIKGLILKIQNGKIQEVQAGSITGKGKLDVAEVTIVEKQFEPTYLPGRSLMDGASPEASVDLP